MTAILAGALLLGIDAFRPLPASLHTPTGGAQVLDRNGVVLWEAAAGVPEAEPWGEPLVLATLAAEDHRVGWHPGVDPIGVLRAARANWRAGEVVQGGSTLAQQLARHLVPRGPGWLGKVEEAHLALRLTAQLTAEERLDAYLRRVWYGNHATGAGAAARIYFDRPPAALSLAQAATLAAIPRRPAELDPRANPGLVQRARDRVLRRLGELGWAGEEELALARAEPLLLVEPERPRLAPHFVQRVAREHSTVRSTLDAALQARAESAATEVLAELRGRHVDHAAVIVVHNPTREVRAYVGSGGWGKADGQVDGVKASRSPGSALKPFLYALALERGRTLATLVDDTPGTWSTTHGAWSPTNYGEGSMGPVTLRVALANSLNVPAVRLLEEVGVADLHRTLQELGFTTLAERPDHYGLGLGLGDGEVRLDELTSAYASFASAGRVRPLRFTADAPKGAGREVFDPVAAFLVADALDDPNARSAAFGHDSALEASYPLAAKTGTSTGFRDNWAVGVSPDYTVGVWVGNFDGREMTEVSGITGAGPLMRRVMDAAMESAPRRAFRRPAGLTAQRTCARSGAAAGPHCPRVHDEWQPAHSPGAACDWHSAAGESLPARLAAWAPAARTHPDGTTLAVVWPTPGAAFWIDHDRPVDQQALTLRSAGGDGEVRWFVNGEPLPKPGRTARWVPSPGLHRVEVESGGVRSEAVSFRVGALAEPHETAPATLPEENQGLRLRASGDVAKW